MRSADEELVGGLQQLLSEVLGHLDSLRRKLATIESDRANIVAMLKFQDEIVVGSEYLPHVSVRRLFKRKELTGYCMQALSASDGMLDTREIARYCMARKGMDSEDILVRKKVVYSVIHTLRTARRKGLVESCGLRKGVLLWRLQEQQRRSRPKGAAG